MHGFQNDAKQTSKTSYMRLYYYDLFFSFLKSVVEFMFKRKTPIDTNFDFLVYNIRIVLLICISLHYC